MSILILPDDVLLYLLKFVTITDLGRLLLTNKKHTNRLNKLRLRLMTRLAQESECSLAEIIARGGRFEELQGYKLTPLVFDSAAKYGQLDLLKELWHNCKGTVNSIRSAIQAGQLSTVKWLNQYYHNQDLMKVVLEYDQPEIFKYFLTMGYTYTNSDLWANENRDNNIINWIYQTKYSELDLTELLELEPELFVMIGLAAEKFGRELSSTIYPNFCGDRCDNTKSLYLNKLEIRTKNLNLFKFIFNHNLQSPLLFKVINNNSSAELTELDSVTVEILKWLYSKYHIDMADYLYDKIYIDMILLPAIHQCYPFKFTLELYRKAVQHHQLECLKYMISQEPQKLLLDNSIIQSIIKTAKRFHSIDIIEWLIMEYQLKSEQIFALFNSAHSSIEILQLLQPHMPADYKINCDNIIMSSDQNIKFALTNKSVLAPDFLNTLVRRCRGKDEAKSRIKLKLIEQFWEAGCRGDDDIWSDVLSTENLTIIKWFHSRLVNPPMPKDPLEISLVNTEVVKWLVTEIKANLELNIVEIYENLQDTEILDFLSQHGYKLDFSKLEREIDIITPMSLEVIDAIRTLSLEVIEWMWNHGLPKEDIIEIVIEDINYAVLDWMISREILDAKSISKIISKRECMVLHISQLLPDLVIAAKKLL